MRWLWHLIGYHDGRRRPASQEEFARREAELQERHARLEWLDAQVDVTKRVDTPEESRE